MRLTNPALLLGIVLLLSATGLAWRTGVFLSRATITRGVIMDEAPHPHIRFTIASGGEITFVQNGFVHGNRGATIAVAYDPSDPGASASAATFWPLWWPTVRTATPGLALVFLAMSGALRSR